MNQTVLPSMVLIAQAAADSGLLVSLCTIREQPMDADSFDESGALLPDAVWPVLEGHENLPCMDAPLNTGDNVSPTELKQMSEILAKNVRHVFFAQYLPQITSTMRAVITGVYGSLSPVSDTITYDIVNAEIDSQSQTTRLACELVTM